MRLSPRAGCLAMALASAAPPVSAQCDLTTLYASNNGGNAGGAVYFDVQVQNSTQITAISVNTNALLGSSIGLDVYTTSGSSVGNETNPSAWFLQAYDNGQGFAAGTDLPSLIPLQSPLSLSPGNLGIALVARNFAHRYTNGNGTNQSYATVNYSLSLGSATNVPFSGAVFRPRVWNGTLHCSGLIPRFSSSTSAGAAPLTVHFSDRSFTTDPSGIGSWSWDLDGNGTIDSTQPNPSFTYPGRGLYDVALTVSDGLHGTATLRQAAYVHVLSNDECSTALVLSDGLSGPFSNRGATTSSPWPCATGGNDVWFRYVASCDRLMEANTCANTTFDSAIEVFDGSCGALVSLACNDDSCGLQSRATFTATLGRSYFIRVGGFAAAEGTFFLTIRGCARLQAAGGAIGDSIGFVLEGDPNETFLLMPSLTTGPTPLAIIDPRDPRSLDVGLDLSVLWVSGRLDSQGNTAVFYALPNDFSLVGLLVHGQFLTLPGLATIIDDVSNPVAALCLAAPSILRCRYVVDVAAGACGGIAAGDTVCLPCPDPNVPLPDNCPIVAGCARAAPACVLSVHRFSQYCLYCPGTNLGAAFVCR